MGRKLQKWNGAPLNTSHKKPEMFPSSPTIVTLNKTQLSSRIFSPYPWVTLTTNCPNGDQDDIGIRQAENTLCNVSKKQQIGPATKPVDVAYLLETFVISRYAYALPQTPLTQEMIQLDKNFQGLLLQYLIYLKQPPHDNKMPLLRGIFRVWSIQTIRNEFIGGLPQKMRTALKPTYATRRKLAQKYYEAVTQLCQYDAIRLPMINKQIAKQLVQARCTV